MLVLVLGELTPATWICGYTRKAINFYSTQGVDSINPVLTWRYDMKIWNEKQHCMISGWRRAVSIRLLDFHVFGVFGQAQQVSRTGWQDVGVLGFWIPQPSRTVHRCTSSSAKSTSKNSQSNKNYKKKHQIHQTYRSMDHRIIENHSSYLFYIYIYMHKCMHAYV